MPKTMPYGSWKSPITSDLIVTGAIGLGRPVIDGEDVFWVESRPTEGGRSVLVKLSAGGSKSDYTPAPFNVRTRVHEYGGGSSVVFQGVAFFSNFADNLVYRTDGVNAPVQLTASSHLRYADFVVDANRQRLVCVREDHSVAGREPVNTVVDVDMETGENQVLVSGNDFYAFPRMSPDGKYLAWTTWNHPNMPWDGTELWVAERLADGSLANPQLVAGGESESVFQPEWSPNGVLHFVSDRTGWWNLYRLRDGHIDALCPMEAEFGLPQWVFGESTYAFAGQNHIVCTYTVEGLWHLATLDGESGKLTEIAIPYTEIADVRASGDQVVFIAGSAVASPAVVSMNLASGKLTVLQASSELQLDSGYLSVPEPIEFPTEEGLTAYGFYYPPKNPDFVAPSEEKPPLIVVSHGGPTGSTSTVLHLDLQYWTSRGFAVLDVNYGGSTGYGRPYRDRLKGRWGIVDVDDCTNGAKFLVRQGLVDAGRIAIKGGSAGGYTTLCALTFRDVFRAGASYFGVSDLELLARDTHKFESRYLDSMVGPYPEQVDVYRERSPIHFTDRLSCPVIFFQGLDDKVVPPNQAELMVQKLRENGVPVAFVTFEGEGHGFRKAENRKRALDGELYFYARVFGFELAEPVEPVEIDNL